MIEKNVVESFKDKKVLITGGTGLIGRQIVKILCDAEARVHVVSLDKLMVDRRATHFNADITYLDTCKHITYGMDYVFHIAGVKGSIEVTKTKPASFFVPILLMNANILEACRINDVKKIVYTSSVGAYSSAEVFKEGENEEGPPMDMFPGWAKRMAEKQIEAYKIQYGMTNFSVVRPANIYGPGDNFDPNNAMVIPSLMMKIRRGDNPVKIWGDGSSVRDFAYSEDVANGIIQALYHGTDGKYMNLGSGNGVTIRELVKTLNSFIDFRYEFDMVQSHNGFPKRVMDISLAQQKIHYDPSTSLREGLEKTWEWFNANPDEYINRKNYFSD
jgi:GDP-L-fucose synthase